MMQTFSYPAAFEPGEDPEVLLVTFPDVPEAITEGTGLKEARAMAADALGVALLGLVEMGREIPKPSKPKKGEMVIAADPEIAAKVAVINAFRRANITQGELALRLGKDAREVRRILDPDHPTKLPSLAAALEALGQRFVLGVMEPSQSGLASQLEVLKRAVAKGAFSRQAGPRPRRRAPHDV